MGIIVDLTGCPRRRGGKTNEVFGADGQTGTGNLLAALPCTWIVTLMAMTANGLQSPIHTF
jgi:hypothetical protein